MRSIILNVDDQRVSQSRRSCKTRTWPSGVGHEAVAFPFSIRALRSARRWPDLRQIAMISRVLLIGFDPRAAAYRSSSSLGANGSGADWITGSDGFSLSSFMTVCTAILTTCGKHRIRLPTRQKGMFSLRNSSSRVSIVVSQFDALSNVNSPTRPRIPAALTISKMIVPRFLPSCFPSITRKARRRFCMTKWPSASFEMKCAVSARNEVRFGSLQQSDVKDIRP